MATFEQRPLFLSPKGGHCTQVWLYSQTCTNGHLWTTARIILIPIFIEKPPKTGHLCTTANILGSLGWPLYTGLTVLKSIETFFLQHRVPKSWKDICLWLQHATSFFSKENCNHVPPTRRLCWISLPECLYQSVLVGSYHHHHCLVNHATLLS